MQVVVFDVNETLLDLAALDPLFERHLGAADQRKAWFGDMLVSAMTLNHIGRYASFPDIARACLATTAANAQKRLSASAEDAILEAMRALPPHPDVVPTLERLAKAGLTLAALTNSPPDTAMAQLEHAGIHGYFSELMTVAEVERLKPAREVYADAARRLRQLPEAIALVAAHPWDLAGAATSGWRTALIARSGEIPNPLYPAPDIVGADLDVVAGMILT
jgi:2-haloacid dehalogenase